ncbi:DUF418 domain-containing protein [Corynebacterium pseudodiphtheriticum]|uniref:DUF418 domain-containing protein n=1 Tax=Corynebacterium pseudodiphtheriticum TaxID=37637 RepID=UPI00254D865E|nr:DUF418 domain-containing protein [Corynebacterium pseudodiphtheriticum]MDK8685259.1 DUF418 domain-containing protein [Corynebacterium pseudodiphtheriticum]
MQNQPAPHPQTSTPPPENPAPQNPPSPAPRMIAPDFARGIALLGIALANIQTAWTLETSSSHAENIESSYFGGYADGSLLDTVFTLFSAMFVHVRGLPMFSTLLGFGIGLIAISLWKKSFPLSRARQVIARRYFFLAVFGLLHIIFLFFGDIMFSYGVMGMIVATMLSLRNKTLGWIIVVLFALNALTGIGIALASMGSTLLNVAGPSNYALGEASEPTSNYLEYLFGNFFIAIFAPFEAIFVAFTLLPVILLGFTWARRGVLADVATHRKELVIWAVIAALICLGIGLPWGLAELGIINQELADPLMTANVFLGIFTGPGILAAIALGCNGVQKKYAETQRVPFLLRPFIALGKRSMSGYVAQSVFFVILVLPFTLNLAEGQTVTGLIVIAFAVWLATLLWAWLWETLGWNGPLETIHRRLGYGPGSRPRLESQRQERARLAAETPSP